MALKQFIFRGKVSLNLLVQLVVKDAPHPHTVSHPSPGARRERRGAGPCPRRDGRLGCRRAARRARCAREPSELRLHRAAAQQDDAPRARALAVPRAGRRGPARPPWQARAAESPGWSHRASGAEKRGPAASFCARRLITAPARWPFCPPPTRCGKTSHAIAHARWQRASARARMISEDDGGGIGA